MLRFSKIVGLPKTNKKLNSRLSADKVNLCCVSPSRYTIVPTQSQVVICGAGVVANSVAYHLIENGWNDVLIIDKGKACCGTSHFGSGTLGLFKQRSERKIILRSLKLYRKLQIKGFNIGLKQCGSINLAQTKDRRIDLKRRMAYNLPTGLHCELIDKNELQKIHPFLYTDDIECAVWVPEDSVAEPQAICKALVKLCSDAGAQYLENCTVEQVVTENNAVRGIQTNKGLISCEYFVNCAGMWARELGWLCTKKVRVPIYPAEHYYVITKPISGVMDDLPYVRDFDASVYMREYNGGFMVGGFEPVAKPAFTEYRLIPNDWKEALPVDWDHFMPFWRNATTRIPILNDSPSPTLINSPDTFTPDGKWIIGETPEVKNYFVAVGMNGNSLQGAGGIGRALAEWIIQGEPTEDLLSFDVQRFLDLHNNRQYLQHRIKEIVGRHYKINYPNQCEYKNARSVRCSPLHSIFEKKGAVFETRMGYERPMYFDTSSSGLTDRTLPAGTYYRPKFLDFMINEYNACRTGIGLIDLSSFSKIRITGQENVVVDWLQKLCSNDINTPVGYIVHTGMHNDKGGYENDCILVKENETNYLMVSPTSQQTKALQWMIRHLPNNRSISLKDVTSMYTVINVVGPRSRELLSELTNSDIDLNPFMCQKVDVGYASNVMMMCFTNTGEPGFSLYIPAEYTIHVYDRLLMIGDWYGGVTNVGSLTQRYMRLEKFIAFWAEDLTRDITPFEAGRDYSVKLYKEYFIGKGALQKQKFYGVTKRLVMFVLEDLDPDKDVWAWGEESIYRNDKFVGTVTSAGYAFSLHKLVCLGFISVPEYHRETNAMKKAQLFVRNAFILDESAKYEVDVAGKRFVAVPHLTAPKMKSPVKRTPYVSNVYHPK